MYQNPSLVQALVRARVAELRQSAETGAVSRPSERRRRVVDVARHGAGWLLIDMGLRLAVPRGALSRPVTGGQGR